MDLMPFAGSNEEEEIEALDLRPNPFQGRRDDGKGPNPSPSLKPSPSSSPTNRRSRPTTRAMARRIQEDWDTTTDGRENFLYMFNVPTRSSGVMTWTRER